MRRRDFILGVGAAASPIRALAQQSSKTWRIGFLAHGYESFYDPFFSELRQLGYQEGRNLVVERRYAAGYPERFSAFAVELVNLQVDLIIVVTTPAALAVKKATTTIPIVFPNAINPVETGVVAGLAYPGGNVTGGAIPTAELSAKRIEFFKQVIPRLLRVAVLWDSANPSVSLGLRDTRTAADKLGVTIQPLAVREPKDFAIAFGKIPEDRPDGMIVFQDALTLQHRNEIIAFVTQERLPTMYTGREWVHEGGLMSYGENLGGMFKRAAYFVEKIFKGTQPADLPVEQPVEFDLVINIKSAQTLGLAFPESILIRADEVVE